MNIESLIGIALAVCAFLGGFIVWFISWLKSLIRAEIASYDRKVKDEKIHDLQEENRRLKEWAEKNK